MQVALIYGKERHYANNCIMPVRFSTYCSICYNEQGIISAIIRCCLRKLLSAMFNMGYLL